MEKGEIIRIDGAYGEGGGQIIRTCLCLAALSGKEFEVFNVRAGRPKPGLQAQHLTAVRSVAEICSADLEGAEIGSTRFRFSPRSKPVAGSYEFSVGTAGATTLVAQSILLPLTRASDKSRVQITGGTHVPFAPIADYLELVYLEALREAGISASSAYDTAGYYPRGGGKLVLEVNPCPGMKPIVWDERGKLLDLNARIITSRLPTHVSERGASAVRKFLSSHGLEVCVDQLNPPSCAPGAAVFICARCEFSVAGFSSLGKVGKPIEEVAVEACRNFIAWWKSDASCDERLADQLVLPASLADGESRWTTPRVTNHLRTVVWVVQQFLPVGIRINEAADGLAEVIVSPVS